MITRHSTLLKNTVGFFLISAALCASQGALAQESGKEIFQQRCAACHTIGGGRLVGPDLAGANDRRPEAWLLKFIKSSQTVVGSGDKDAVALFDQYGKVVMPDQDLSDAQIKSILAYLKEKGGSVSAEKPSTPAPETTPKVTAIPTQSEIQLGQNLFQGKVRFANMGPSCISCHNVKNDAIIGGGILAKDLTLVFSRMGAPGVSAILGSPPFPVMQAAYEGKPFTPEETRALIAFLQEADQEQAFQQPRDYGWGLFSAGVVGVIILFGFYAVVGRHRKRGSVNQAIYDRQLKSE